MVAPRAKASSAVDVMLNSLEGRVAYLPAIVMTLTALQ